MVTCLIVVGLIYDAAGVWALARAFAFGRLWGLQWQSLTLPGGNLETFRALVLQRSDARWGLILIVLGFAFQIAGTCGLKVPSSACVALFILLIPTLAVYDERRTYLQRKAPELFAKIEQQRQAQQAH
jgi:hypothetical protein